MLILTRKPGEAIYIGTIKVTLVEITQGRARLGIDAPREIRVDRQEVHDRILQEQGLQSAGDGATAPAVPTDPPKKAAKRTTDPRRPR